MTEVLFYHLENRPLEAVLPALLQKTLERGWTAVVQAGSAERLEALDTHLWTFTDESFLPHGTAADGFEAEQPVFLTTDDANPNGAAVRFLVDRAPPPLDPAAYQRLVLVFDGGDPDALAEARAAWKRLKADGHEVTYWQQTARGGWERKA
ncbi:DNA polymerase III subunit chi [Chthonobacter rhizosphaerae]|uniref:DNA polymerase III subunit chi n=1 Tax=Chthonobacter rhizosphaerae TaxID=2735553 RepID=UPI0015EFCDF8|nr:DNA polymerase III subunit chi [Chthonobacter rhizosphaerae]